MVRKWEFFINRWVQIYDFVASTAKAVQEIPKELSKLEAAKVDVLINKTVRAKHVLEQLQEAEKTYSTLREQYEPLLKQLPQLQQEISTPELHRLQQFAVDEGMTPLVSRIAGAPLAHSRKLNDPFGIRLALSGKHPLALMTWRDYSGQIKKLMASAVLAGPNMQQLLRFNLARKSLLAEMQALRQQLVGDVDIPPLEPLVHDCQRLDDFVAAVQQVHQLHLHMLRRDLSSIDWPLLELRLKLREGDAYRGSRLEQALHGVRLVHSKVMQGGMLDTDGWHEFEQNMQHLAATCSNQDPTASDVAGHIQRYQQELMRSLGQYKAVREAAA